MSALTATARGCRALIAATGIAPGNARPAAPVRWAVSGYDREAGAIGALQPFAVNVWATDTEAAKEAAMQARYAAGFEAVEIRSIDGKSTLGRGWKPRTKAEWMAAI